jgi:hypothetical protein
MWILMYVFSFSLSPAATNDRAEWRLLPTVVFQEFPNEERCRATKSTPRFDRPVISAYGLGRVKTRRRSIEIEQRFV